MLSLGNYLIHSVYHNVKLLFAIGARGTPIASPAQGIPPPIGQEAPTTCSCCPCACEGSAGHWQFHTCLHERRHNCGDVFCRGQRWTRNARPHPPPCRCCRSHRCCNPQCNRNRSRSPLYPEALQHPDRTRTRRRHCPHESRSCIACLHCEFLSDNSDACRQRTPSRRGSAPKFLSGHEEDVVGSGDFLNRNAGNDSDVDSNRFHRTSSCHTSTTKFFSCRDEDTCSKDGTDADVSDNESDILCDTNDKQVCEREAENENEIRITQVAKDCEKPNNKKEVEIFNVYINKRLRSRVGTAEVGRGDVLEDERSSESQSSSIFHINEHSEDEGEWAGIDDFNDTAGTDVSDETGGSGIKIQKYVSTFGKIPRKDFVSHCPEQRPATGTWVGLADISNHKFDENINRGSRISSAPIPSTSFVQRTRKILKVPADELCHSFKRNSPKSHTECASKCSSEFSCDPPDKCSPKTSDTEVKFLKRPSSRNFCTTPEGNSEQTISWKSHDSLTLSPPRINEEALERSKKSLKRKIDTNSESPLKRNEKNYIDRRSGNVVNEPSLGSCKRYRVGNSKANLEKKYTESGNSKLNKELYREAYRKDTIEKNPRRKAKAISNNTQTILQNIVNRKLSGISHEGRSDVNGKITEVRQQKRSKDCCSAKGRLNLKRHPKDIVSKSSEYSFNTSSGISFKRNSFNNLDDCENVSPKKKRKDSCVSEHENIRQKPSKNKSRRNSQETCSRRCILPPIDIRRESHSGSLGGSRNISKKSLNKRHNKSSNSEVGSELNSSSALFKEKKAIVSDKKKHYRNTRLSGASTSLNLATTDYFVHDAILTDENPSVVEVWHCAVNQSESSVLNCCESNFEYCKENSSFDSDTGSSRQCTRCGPPNSSARRKFVWHPEFARKVANSEGVVDKTQESLSRHWKNLDFRFRRPNKPSCKPMGKGQVSTKCKRCMFLSLRGLKKVTVNPFINFYLVYLRNIQKICPKCASVPKVAVEAGKIWRCMNERDRKPFLKMAMVARSHLGVLSKSKHNHCGVLKVNKRTNTARRQSASPKPPAVCKYEPRIRPNQRSVGTDNPYGRVGRRMRAATYPRSRGGESPVRLFVIKHTTGDNESNMDRLTRCGSDRPLRVLLTDHIIHCKTSHENRMAVL